MEQFVLAFVMIFLSMKIRYSYERRLNVPVETNYVVRVFNYSTLDFTGQPFLENMKWTVRNMKQYISADAVARKTYVLHRIFVRFERCRDLEIACEDFQTWNVSKEICLFFKMKNQVWSPMLASINLYRFPQTCPRIEKGIYEVREFNLNDCIDWVLMFYNEAPKYYWKIHSYFYNSKNEMEYQSHAHGRIIGYTKRNRTPIPLPQ